MADIQQQLAGLATARITPAVLQALDFVVPGEWQNVTSLDQAIRAYVGVTDPAEIARIQERALALWSQRPHYQRALTVLQAVDTADVAIAATVAASAVGSWNPFAKITPRADTIQAIDAALKLAAEVAAFALLRGLPTASLAEAAAFPAALATYAKADMMRLAAWIAIDGLLPLGPDFVQKIVGIVQKTDASMLAANPVYHHVKEYLPGSSPEEQKGFIVSTLGAGASYVNEFVGARGLTQAGLAGKLGSLVGAADKGMDVLAAALDASTSYYSHTGVQSVARALVHDAQESLASGEVVGPAVPTEEEGSSWFNKTTLGAGAAIAAAGAAALWSSWGDDDDDEDAAAQIAADPELQNLDDNALAAREAAIEMQAREAMKGPQTPEQMQQLMQLRMQRRRMRQARRMRMMQQMQQGQPGMGGMGPGMGRGMGGRGGGMGGRGMGGGGRGGGLGGGGGRGGLGGGRGGGRGMGGGGRGV